MNFSQAFLLLALGLFVSLPQEVKCNRRNSMHGGGHHSSSGGLLGTGLLGGGGVLGTGLLGGGLFGGEGSTGGSTGGRGGHGGWSSSSGSGGFMGSGGWSHSGGSSSSTGGGGIGGGIGGGWGAGGTGGASGGGYETGGGQAAGGEQTTIAGQATGGGQEASGNYLGVFGQIPGSHGSPNIMYPYGEREGDDATPNVDDGAVEVPISKPFIFFGKTYNSLFVNNNGVVSCGVPVSKYTPAPFPLADGSAFVAPYWGDVNNQQSGKVLFRESNDPALLQRVSDDINRYFPNINFRANWLFIATWDKVPYYGSKSDKVNTFQAVLTSNGKLNYIILNYDDIQWTTGAASKGNPYTGLGGFQAQAGFNGGDDTHYFNIPGSRTDDIINIAATSNVNVPGRWVFRVDNFSVPGGCVAGVNFAKFGDIFWKDDACEEKCTCQPDGETACSQNQCSISEVCKSVKWYFVCDAPDSCM